MMYLTLLFINIILTTIIGIWDAPNQIASGIMEILTKGKLKQVYLKKPFSCPLCMTFWVSFFYLCFYMDSFQSFVFCLFLSVLNAYLTQFVLLTIQVLERFISKILALFDRLISRI